MDQPELFYESFEDALRDDVKALGGLKKVGPMFWPEKDTDGAARTLADKLNAARRDRLTDEQERFIMKLAAEKRGFSAAVCFICDDTGFERPKPRSVNEEKAAALRTIADASHTLKRALETVERLSQTTLSRVA